MKRINKKLLTLLPIMGVLVISACRGHSSYIYDTIDITVINPSDFIMDEPTDVEYGVPDSGQTFNVGTYGEDETSAIAKGNGTLTEIEGYKAILSVFDGEDDEVLETYSSYTRSVLGFSKYTQDDIEYITPIFVGVTPESVGYRYNGMSYLSYSTFSAMKYNGDVYYFSIPFPQKVSVVDIDSDIDDPYYCANTGLKAVLEIIHYADKNFLGSIGATTTEHVYYHAGTDAFYYLYNDHFYRRTTGASDFNNLEKEAERSGGHLAIADNTYENQFLSELLGIHDYVFQRPSNANIFLGVFASNNQKSSFWKKVYPYGTVMDFSMFVSEEEAEYSGSTTSVTINADNPYWQLCGIGAQNYGIYEYDSWNNIGNPTMFGMFGGQF